MKKILYQALATIILQSAAASLVSCTSFPFLASPTPEPSPTPERGNPVLSAENVQTKIEISPRLVITLDRSQCLGSCPSYHVTIHGDGRVVYRGEYFVPTEGTVEKQIQEDQLQQIISALEDENFFGILENDFAIVILDSSELTVSVKTDGEFHELSDNGVCSYAHPAIAFCNLGNKIDAILGTPW